MKKKYLRVAPLKYFVLHRRDREREKLYFKKIPFVSTGDFFAGFTLIELMIVVAVISLLAMIAIPKFTNMIQKAKEAATKGNLATLRAAVSVYYADNEGIWPQQRRVLDDDAAVWHYESSWLPGATAPDPDPDHFESLMLMRDPSGMSKYLDKIPDAYIGQRWMGVAGYNKEKTRLVGTYHWDVVPLTIAVRGPDTEWLWEVWMYCCDTGDIWVNANKVTGPRLDTKGEPITNW